MSYKVQISLKAEIEIKAAQDWYEKQATGLGEKFADEIKGSIDSLLNPIADHKHVFKNLRRILLYRFPYSVYYIRNEKAKLLEIIAVLHNRQSQDSLEKRI